jgi:aspartate aminotransferase
MAVRSATRFATDLAPSATLAGDQRIRERIAAGQPILHLAFGEAGLPVPADVLDALARAANQNAYGPVAGTAPAREAAAGYLQRRQLPSTPDQIVFAPGSKPLLWALIAMLPGDVILPRPSWVSYAAHAQLAGRRVFSVDVTATAGGVPDPDALTEALARARDDGGRPGILVLTLPDNPTGTLAPAAQVTRVSEIAEAHDLAIISDEIYRDLAHRPQDVLSPAQLVPRRTYVTNGLSKSMALGGWRIGFARLPDGPAGADARRALTALASEVWSSLATPMQSVAAYVLSEPAEVTAHVRRSRRLHRLTTEAVHAQLTAAGVSCRVPGGGFYLYPDLEPLRERLREDGVDGADALAEHLLDRHQIGVLSGAAFGDDPAALRFRLATSLLYGDTDAERRQTLESEDPVTRPGVQRALDRLRSALGALGDGPAGP